MKVPFLNGRVQSEYDAYLDELQQSVTTSVGKAKLDKAHGPNALFKVTYPLFTLLRCLADPSYMRDPSRDAIFTELALVGDKQNIVNAIRFFNKPHAFQNQLMKGLHRRTFTAYFDELFSDGLLLLNSFYTNNYRGAYVAVRCMLEDTYRHLYFKDHPEEFSQLLNGEFTERDLDLRPIKFRDFLTRASYLSVFHGVTKEFGKPVHEVVDGIERQLPFFTLFNLNEELYRACSGYVHGSEFNTLNSFKTNADLTINAKRQVKLVSLAKDFVKMSVAFLIAAHIDQFLAASEYERSIILSAYSEVERGGLRLVLNV